MSGRFLLDWALMAISLFNTILLFWLGMTVLLNAERRTWAIWLAGAGPLLGGLFFFIHSAILIQGLSYVSWGMDFWWHIGWLPIIVLPIAWYAMTLWYAGFWQEGHLLAQPLHKVGLPVTALLAAGLAGLFLFSIPLPSIWQVIKLDLSASPSVGGISLLILAYPLYSLLCIGLSLQALWRPGPPRRLMADLARRRARPWLVAAAIALLLASLLVSGAVVWIIYNAHPRPPGTMFTVLSPGIAWFDLAISTLIGASVLALGTAVVSYEVFTGKALPRRGLRRYWRNAAILAAGYGFSVGWSLTYRLHALYSLLLSILLITLFFALLSWRSFTERERYIGNLRPFVTSQRLYDHLVTPAAATPADATPAFRALCGELLGARVAYLIPWGPLAPLAGPPLSYPGADTSNTGSRDARALPSLADVVAQLTSPQAMFLPIDPTRYRDAAWAIPLWSERGLIGLLLLGEKRDGGLYTQEEIEIARASGERLVDTQASAEMARRLMALQRQRLAEGQVLDRRTRRVLHDEVLPALHTAMLNLNDGAGEALPLLAGLHRQISDLLHDAPASATPQVARLGLPGALRHAVEEEFAGAFDAVRWHIDPCTETAAARLPPLTTEVLYYAAREAVRNAARHGRGGAPDRPLHLDLWLDWDCEASPWDGGLRLAVEDDGVGIALPTSPEEGQGLALHGTMMAVVGGSLELESLPGLHTRVTLRLPPLDDPLSPPGTNTFPLEAYS